MKRTGEDVAVLIARVTPAARRRDAEVMLALMQEITGHEPEMWEGGIFGFGTCHYRYPTGTEGDSPVLGFAPRKQATTIYLLDGIETHREALEELGTYSKGAGCLYLRDMAAVDAAVLRRILTTSWESISAGEIATVTLI